MTPKTGDIVRREGAVNEDGVVLNSWRAIEQCFVYWSATRVEWVRFDMVTVKP